MTQEIEIWKKEKETEIRKLFAPKLTDSEFAYFLSMGQTLKANPFKREIWAIKYDNNAPAQVFLGRDFYLRKAQEQEEYKGHVADAVYSNDAFEVINGIPQHKYHAGDRGKLIGAYCIVYCRNRHIPTYVFVQLNEYNTGKSLWSKMPATMITKVAEAQALRKAFMGVFGGTYSDAEQWESSTSKIEIIEEHEEMYEYEYENKIKTNKDNDKEVINKRLKEKGKAIIDRIGKYELPGEGFGTYADYWNDITSDEQVHDWEAIVNRLSKREKEIIANGGELTQEEIDLMIQTLLQIEEGGGDAKYLPMFEAFVEQKDWKAASACYAEAMNQ